MLITRDRINDEIVDQQIEYREEASISMFDLIKWLIERNFLPTVPEHSLWSISNADREIGLYQPAGPGSYVRGDSSIADSDAQMTIHFTYYPDGEKRANYLFRFFDGNKRELYFKGYMEEYRGYHVSKEIEQKWRDVLIQEERYHDFDEHANIQEALLRIKEIMIRPGMYVGRNRLDFVQIYFDGWRDHQKSVWSLSHDLKQWMFLRECVYVGVSLNGWNAFYQTYGVTDHAIEQFREFLNTNEPTSVFDHGRWDTATEHIGHVWFPELHQKNLLPSMQPYLDFEHNEETTKEAEELEILRQIKRIVGKECRRIKVYINSGGAAEQVRFFCDTGSGWTDGITLNDTPDYYEKMVVLFGYIKLTNKELFKTSITTIFWSEDRVESKNEVYQAPEFSFARETSPAEEYLLCNQFSAWKIREL